MTNVQCGIKPAYTAKYKLKIHTKRETKKIRKIKRKLIENEKRVWYYILVYAQMKE